MKHTLKSVLLLVLSVAPPLFSTGSQDWIKSARTFLIDAYQYPFAPELEYDAEALAQAMQAMDVNTVRIGTMGKYATIQGVRFPAHTDQNGRDLLDETIAACKPRGIRVVPYISTGHKLAWSHMTGDYAHYAQQTTPGGPPARSHMYAGEDHGTVCWNTPYREAYLDMVEHVVRDYDIDGIYFDTWKAFYFFPDPQLCYCPGCRDGFRRDTGLEIPYREGHQGYSPQELETIESYHRWYHDRLVDILTQVRQIVKSHKDIPLIYNINDPAKIVREDPRVISRMNAFLYERGQSILERAEGVSLARALGLAIWPYVGSYDNWPRVIHNGLDFGQEIYVTAMFGGAPIISQPYAFVEQPEKREIVAGPFRVLAANERFFAGFENVPHVAVVYGLDDPPMHHNRGWWWEAGTRSSSKGAFAACLYNHVQVSSVLQSVLDKPELLARYKVLCLADITSLTAQQVRNVNDFVDSGGGLVASYATSLYNSDGSRNNDFALGALLGVKPARLDSAQAFKIENYTTMVGGPNELYLRTLDGQPAPLDRWAGELLPLWYYEPVDVLPGARVAAEIVTGDRERPILPGVVLTEYGKGKVAYLSSSLESLFLGANIAELGEFTADLIRLVSPAPAPFRLDGPAGLLVNMTERDNWRVLHLANWTGNKLERNWVNEYYLAPLRAITLRVAIPAGKRVAELTTLVDNTPEWQIEGDEVLIRMAEIGAYQAVAIRFE